MDITATSFYPVLLDILKDVSEAHFVALDLELSGVPSKSINPERTGKPSLQERYRETKEAAERYQILQFGLTCVTQDLVTPKYTLKPYNFDLSPLISERSVDIERIFSFQSGAVDFLLKVGFDLRRPFEQGVPYLSRAESAEAREKHAKRQDKSALADIQIKPTEIESWAFLQRVRNDISAWLTAPNAAAIDHVNICAAGVVDAKDAHPTTEELSRFEKRLVHQLVRAEFPELVTIGKPAFVQVRRFEKEREDRIQADRRREMHERVNRQKGFRWVIEALLGSNLGSLDLRECAKDAITGEAIFVDMDEYRAVFQRAHGLIQGNPRVIVGHNCFLDLVYIYRTFIGQLPETVEEFQRKIHGLWPMVVDTKYMSTHNCGDINPVSSLEQMASQLSSQAQPILETAVEHRKYEDVEAFHEAGYDSFLTAQIAVRLSSKLEKQGRYVEMPSTPTKQTHGMRPVDSWDLAAQRTTNGSTHPDVPGVDALHLTESASTLSPTAKGFVPSRFGGPWKRTGDPSVIAVSNDENDPGKYTPSDLTHRYKRDDRGIVVDGMPRFSSDFWRVYGNKLRVFGTEEGVCGLAPEGAEEESDEGEGEREGQGGVEVECP